MYIGTATKANPLKEQQIDASIHKIWVKCSFDANPDNFKWNPVQAVLQELNMLKISLQRQTKDGNVHILLPTSVGDLAEISSNHEGHVNAKFTAKECISTTATHGKMEVEFQFQVSPYALKAEDGRFLLLSVDTSAWEAYLPNFKMEFYGIDFPIKSMNHTEYRALKANANAVKSISCLGIDTLSFPSGGFQQLDLIFPDRTLTFKDDVRAIPQAVENLIANYVGLHSGTNPDGSTRHSFEAQTVFDRCNLTTIGVSGVLEARILYDRDRSDIFTTQFEKQG